MISVQETLGLSEVDLTSAPAPNIFLGKFEEGQVDLVPFDLDVLGSLASGRVRSEGPLSGTLRAELSEEEVAGIAVSYAVASARGVELEEGRVTIGSEVEVLGLSVPVGAEGKVAVQDGALRFEPRRIEALGRQAPDRLARRLLREAVFSYPVGELAEVSGVEVHEDHLVFTGEIMLTAL